MEVLFSLIFSDIYSERYRDVVLDDFIFYLEDNGLLYGGGMDEIKITGGVYYEKEDDGSSLEHLKEILHTFYECNENVFSSLVFT